MSLHRIPLWLKIAYSAWMVVWVPVYWRFNGPQNFLWFCDVANFVLLVALWRESRLLVSSQAVGVMVIQLAWIVDFAGRLLAGVHLIGGTEYMFDPAEPLVVRALSLFHLWVPLLISWLLRRLGYDRRSWKLQTALAWIVLPITFWWTDPGLNINWLQAPFGIEQQWMAPSAFLILAMLACPLVLYFPSHAFFRAVCGDREPAG